MSDLFVEPPAPVMGEAAFQRRRQHLLSELERPVPHRLRPATVGVLVAVVALGVLGFAPISGASIAHRLVTGLGDIWSSPAPPPKNPAGVEAFAQDVPNRPPGVTYQGGTPLPADARDLLSGLGTGGDETITAFPTTSGEVCYSLSDGGGSCANLETWPWQTVAFAFSIFSSRDGGTRVYGVAADKVTSISVEIAGVEHPAILKNNALFYQLPASIQESDIQQITATWNDGSTHSVPVNSHWNPPHG